jgi:hypothetical protein
MDWDSDIQPVLKATYDLLDEDDETSAEAVCTAMGRAPDDEWTRRVLGRLHKIGYIAGPTVTNDPVPVSIRETEKGLQQAKGWPGGDPRLQVEGLLAILDERIADPETPEQQRGLLRRIRDAVGEVAPRLMAQILVEYANRQGLGGAPSGSN